MNHHHVSIEDAETTFLPAQTVKDLRNQIDFILYFETKPLSPFLSWVLIISSLPISVNNHMVSGTNAILKNAYTNSL